MRQHIEYLVRDRLEEAFSEKLEIRNQHSLGGGCINHASKLDTSVGNFFVKWNDQGPKDLFLREAECLEELSSAATCLYIPRVFVKTARTSDNPALLITEFLPPPQMPSARLDEQLGRGLAQLHQYQHEKFGFYHDNYCGATPQDNRWNPDWVDFFGQQRIAGLLRLIENKRQLSGEERQTYEQLINKLPQLIGHQPAPSLNHGDLWSGNYMYAEKGAALIDPASYYADREFDLAMMGMFGGFSDRVWQAYREVYPLPPEWKDRHQLYMLYHYLNHYYLFGGAYGQQAYSIARSYL
jgi:fructosamine-3-kinase